jgi:hypothetical protein
VKACISAKLNAATICNFQLPPPVSSTGHEMLVVLHTDGSISHRGFRASWSTNERVCKSACLD